MDWRLILFLASVHCSQATVQVAVSKLTSLELIQAFKSSAYDILMWPSDDSFARTRILFDYTNSEYYSRQLVQASKTHHFLLFSHHAPAKWASEYQFFIHPSVENDTAVLKELLDRLAWSSFHLIGSLDSLESTQSLSQKVKGHTESYSVILPASFETYAFKAVKTTGNWKSVVLSERAEEFVAGLKAARIYKAGCGLVVARHGAWGQFDTGTVAVVEKGLEGCNSYGDYELRAIHLITEQFYRMNLTASQEYLDYAEQLFPDKTVFTKYSVLNYVNATGFEFVGNADSSGLDLHGRIVFPGGVSEIPNDTPIIQFSASTYPFNFDGSFSALAYQISQGLEPMVELLNQDPDLIPNFKLVMHVTNCGPTVFDHEFFTTCLGNHLPSLGVFYIIVGITDVELGTLLVLRELDKPIPLLGIDIRSNNLHDKTLYPEIVIPLPFDFNLAGIFSVILGTFDWRHSLLVFDEFDVGSEYANGFVQAFERMDIEVHNLDNMGVFIDTDKEKFNAANIDLAKSIINSKVRVIASHVSPPYDMYLVLLLYELGMRRGDLLFVLSFRPSYVFDLFTEEELDHLYELLDGSLTIFFGGYIGEYGEELGEYIAEAISPLSTAYTSLPINCLLLAANAIDMMLTLGKDFEDHWLLNEFIRLQRIMGTNGKLSISASANTLSQTTFYIYNSKSTTEYSEVIVGEYKFGITIPFKLNKEIHWAMGADEPPSAIREAPVCGFKDDVRQKNSSSYELTAILLVFLFVVILVVSFVGLRKMKILRWPLILDKREIMFEDALVMLLGPIELVQLALFSPTFVMLEPLVSLFSNILSKDLQVLFTLKFSDFWLQFYLCLGVTIVWVVCFWVKVLRVSKLLPSMLKSLIYWLGIKLTVFFTQTGFLFVFFVTIKLFNCFEGFGDNLQDSVLFSDCTMQCWEGIHLWHVVFASLFLIIFGVTTAISRVYFDYYFIEINIRVDPIFWVLKINGFVSLMMMHSLLWRGFEFFYCGWCVCLLVFSLRITPYNYHRVVLWQRAQYLMLCANAGLGCVFEDLSDTQKFYSFIGLLVLFAIIGVATIIIQVQKYPSKLYRIPGRRVEGLFLFMFGKKYAIDNTMSRPKKYMTQKNSSVAALEKGHNL